MTSEKKIPRKFDLNAKTTTLRRSASTTNIGVLLSAHLHLRDSKSYTGGMYDNKSESSDENEVCLQFQMF